MSVQVSYKKQFTLGVIIILIILAAVEGIVRIYEFFFLPCRPAYSEAYESMNYFLVKQICVDIRFLQFIEPDVVQNKPNQHHVTINVNSHGLRGPEISIEKPENTYRVIIIGGSTTFGHGSSSDDTTIPAFVQKKFDKENLSKNIQVINAGVNSLYSFTETYHIKNKLMKFNPDLIVNYGGGNDADLYIPNPKVKTPEEYKKELESFKFRNYPFYRTPFMVFTLFFAQEYKEQNFPELINPHEEVVSAWKTRWIDLCEFAKDNDFKTLIVIQPGVGTDNKPLTKDELKYRSSFGEHDLTTLKNLEGFAESFGELSQVCDRTADLRNTFDNVSEPIYWDSFHMTDFGNKIVAERLYEEILPLVLEDIKN